MVCFGGQLVLDEKVNGTLAHVSPRYWLSLADDLAFYGRLLASADLLAGKVALQTSARCSLDIAIIRC